MKRKDNTAEASRAEQGEGKHIISYGQSILAHEASAITSLAQALDQSFAAAVSSILDIVPQGRLIVSGIGKTGFVGMKISATFASIGVPSFFLHPAEAVHGDLGRVTARDLVMLLSNSGETPELIQMIPGLKKIGSFVIGVTSNGRSVLAERSDLTLCLSKAAEAGPLGLAPTTSTTNMLALGDALAMTVSSLRPITREQFATFHPGGNLGRTLLLVSEVMRRGEEICIVREDEIVRAALKKITETKGRPGAAAVINGEGIITGVFTDGDLRRLLNKESNFLEYPISQVMGRTPKVVSASVLANEALRLLTEYQIDQVFVVDEPRHPIGMVDIQDLVRWNTNALFAADY